MKGTTIGDDIATILEETVAGHFADNADWRGLGLRARARIHRAIEAAAREVTDVSSRERVIEQLQASLEAKLGELQVDVAGEEVGTDGVVGMGVVLAILIPLLIQLIPVLVDLIIKWIKSRQDPAASPKTKASSPDPGYRVK